MNLPSADHGGMNWASHESPRAPRAAPVQTATVKTWAREIRRGLAEIEILYELLEIDLCGVDLVGVVRTRGIADIPEGSIYQILRRMQLSKLITSRQVYDPTLFQPPKRIYTITCAGSARLRQMVAEWQLLSARIERLIEDSKLESTEERSARKRSAHREASAVKFNARHESWLKKLPESGCDPWAQE